ncbi:MAG: arginine--tRNA ligase, partial [Oscillospiraceae bacterium]|nr:arginine--tRNA ligase [Oscillospiraceae bacterium]
MKGVLHLNHISASSAEAKNLIMDAMGRLVAEGVFPPEPLPAFNIEIPADRAHGDFAANVAMVSAKALHMAPRRIAETIEGALDLEGSSFDKVEIAGPGFMNFYLAQKWYSGVIRNVTEEAESYGKSDIGKGQRVLVEFVSANPTGPMHVGNARGGAIGDSLASVLQAAGYETEREFYINDAGNQIEKFGKSLDLRYMQLCSDKGQALMRQTGSTEALCKAVYGDCGNTEDFPMPEDV